MISKEIQHYSSVGDRSPAGNTSTGWLKIIALLFMLIDHSGKVLFNDLAEMRMLGRIAFPIYVWCIVVGIGRTHSVPRYLLRLLITGLVSQPLYLLALNSQGHLGILISQTVQPLAEGFSWAGLGEVLRTVFVVKPNIFLTLFLGLAALWGIREKKWLSQIWGPAAAIALATVLNADYGWRGVVLFILLYAVRDRRSGIAAVMVAYFLFWGASYRVTSSLFGMTVNLNAVPAFLSGPLSAFMRLETYALFSLPFILIRYPKKNLRMKAWLGYGLYPAHLVLLIVLKVLMFGWM